jgi:hypothetical protein
MINFLTPSILFAINEIYYLRNKKGLDIKFKERDIESTTRLDLIYYLLRFVSWIWIILGIFEGSSSLFLVVFVLSFIKFPLFHISLRCYYWWIYISSVIRIVLLTTLFVKSIS